MNRIFLCIKSIPVILALAAGLPTQAADAEALLDRALTGDHRESGNVKRDPYRHPKETLMFFGMRPDMTVLEILPGGGWYTEVLAPYLRDEGRLLVATRPMEELDHDYFRNRLKGYFAKLDARPDVYDNVERIHYVRGGEYLPDTTDNSVDMILVSRATHNMIRFGGLHEAYSAFYRVLKPGGILAVVQHRATPGGAHEETAQNGYVPQNYVIGFAEGIGFELAGRSEVNANPKDTRDHPEGVWTLPPGFRLGDKDREKYRAIGESDRMTLKFVKPE
ncbi:MAG: methyltransferase domain-containing protein [Gammaproteobacteria bacterium]